MLREGSGAVGGVGLYDVQCFSADTKGMCGFGGLGAMVRETGRGMGLGRGRDWNREADGWGRDWKGECCGLMVLVEAEGWERGLSGVRDLCLRSGLERG